MSVPTISENYYKYQNDLNLDRFPSFRDRSKLIFQKFKKGIYLLGAILICVNLTLSLYQIASLKEYRGTAKSAQNNLLDQMNSLVRDFKEGMLPELKAITNSVSLSIPTLISETRLVILNAIKNLKISSPIAIYEPAPAYTVAQYQAQNQIEYVGPFKDQWEHTDPLMHSPIWTQGYRICSRYYPRSQSSMMFLSGMVGTSDSTTNPFCEKDPLLGVYMDHYALAFSIMDPSCTRSEGHYFEVGSVQSDRYNRPLMVRTKSALLYRESQRLGCSLILHQSGAYYFCMQLHNLTVEKPTGSIYINLVNMDYDKPTETHLLTIPRSYNNHTILDIALGEGLGTNDGVYLYLLISVTLNNGPTSSYHCYHPWNACPSTSDEECIHAASSMSNYTGRVYQAILRIKPSEGTTYETDIFLFDTLDYPYPRTGDLFFDPIYRRHWAVTDNGGWLGAAQLIQFNLSHPLISKAKFIYGFQPRISSLCGQTNGCQKTCFYEPKFIPAVLSPLGPSYTAIGVRNPETPGHPFVKSWFKGNFQEKIPMFRPSWNIMRGQTRCTMWKFSPWCFSISEVEIPTRELPGTLMAYQVYNPVSTCSTYTSENETNWYS
ncbi:attachment glycoprotein [Longquan Berylmys bowersi morbillivirus 1]|uniref:Attachment glycoprotein n=1 Tax=Longquan Berylmys bowersi morbillivirus 1 TaxID=2877504 RepID=A0AAE9BU74_9MONO|nr:attachment glycoprotein [Longquan Berylmys bowersi morbillivirus 1]